MDFGPKMAMFSFFYIGLFLILIGVSIYVLILLIKALKVYIKKNS